MDYLLLISSVLAGGGRSLFVKGCNKSIENAAQLFFCTFLSSLIAGILIASSGTGDLMIPDRRTVLFAVLFASANIMVDICNMQAIKTGSYALSSVFLSSNFIIPSLSGAFFWNEPISGSQIIGLVLIVVALVIVTATKDDLTAGSAKWGLLAFGSLVFGGCIGLVQKSYCMSARNVNLTLMLVIACIIKTIFAFICFSVSSLKQYGKMIFSPKNKHFIMYVMGMSVCMAYVMKANLYLSGALPSMITFPCLNGGEILVTTLCSVAIVKEKLSARKILGIAAIICGIVLSGNIVNLLHGLG